MKVMVNVLVMVTMMIMLGCGTPKQVAYKTLAAVGLSVSAAADTLALARHQGLVSNDDWEKAKAVHKDYLEAYNTAAEIAAYDFASYSPQSLVALEIKFLTTVDNILKRNK